MWILGHTVLAYLVIKLISRFTKLKLEGRVIACIFIFANLIDALHVGVLRTLVHNPLGTISFTVFWIFFFGKFNLIEKQYYAWLMIASALHVVGDLLFAGYYLFIPFNYESLSLYSWNSFENLVAESILAIIFLFVFINTNDNQKFSKFIVSEKRHFLDNFSTRKILEPSFFLFYALVSLFIFAFVQFNMNLVLNVSELIHGVWYVWIFTVLFLLFQYHIAFSLIYSGKNSRSAS